MYSRSKKKNYFNTNYRREIKLVPMIMDCCLFQIDALKFFLRVRQHGRISGMNEINTFIIHTSNIYEKKLSSETLL